MNKPKKALFKPLLNSKNHSKQLLSLVSNESARKNKQNEKKNSGFEVFKSEKKGKKQNGTWWYWNWIVDEQLLILDWFHSKKKKKISLNQQKNNRKTAIFSYQKSTFFISNKMAISNSKKHIKTTKISNNQLFSYQKNGNFNLHTMTSASAALLVGKTCWSRKTSPDTVCRSARAGAARGSKPT